MSERTMRNRTGAGNFRLALWALGFSLALSLAAQAAKPVDAPVSNEPRVEVATCLTTPGLVTSQGTGQRYVRMDKGEALYSRDVIMALPGFKVDTLAASKGVKLTLWGNLPGQSDSPVLESTVILHDTKAFDLDFTLIRGRVVLTNNRTSGAAKVWLRAEGGVQLVLPQPGDAVAIESFGRWPSGVPFRANRPANEGPIRLWEIDCLKGKLEIKTGRTEWYMSEPPGPSYFHGDSVTGPSRTGPEKRDALPEWYVGKSKSPEMAKMIENVITTYTGKLKSSDPDEIAAGLLALAEKDENKDRARAMRYMIVHAAAAMDDVDRVADLLGNSKHDEERKAAVVALRHWIGARDGRDDKLFDLLQHGRHYSKAEAATVMQLLHSPFDPSNAETYQALIAYLKHRKQSVRELAHWHLVRLAPGGQSIKFDAAGSPEDRDKAVESWKELIPPGELPRAKSDGTKKGK
jgi:hypothetical protein